MPWYSAKSIGVVTFNAKQQALIQEILEAQAAEREMLLPQNLFVKNIENVQGDERDIIIFSVGYAPDSQGRMRMQFGSLNAAHGENRLNVAVSRAREHVYVVSSIEPEQLKVEGSTHAGPKLFRAYLEFARSVSKNGFTPKPNPRRGRKYSRELSSVLADSLDLENFTLTPIQPFADLTALQGANYSGVVLTDDSIYYTTPTLKESHAYIYKALEKDHWPYIRVYSREYWNNPNQLIENISRFLNNTNA